MRLAEIFLRLGSSLVGWMVLYANTLWLAVSARVTCGEEGAELFGVLLGLAPVTLLTAPLIMVSRPLVEVHRMLRWLAIPILLLLPFCLFAIYRVVLIVYGAGVSICGEADAPAWQFWWVPVELVVIAASSLIIAFAFRCPSTDIELQQT